MGQKLMAEPSKYVYSKVAVSYAPDPLNLGKFQKLVEYIKEPELTRCKWCGSSYSFEKHNCPNCGGPK
jgi:hypothetical protein